MRRVLAHLALGGALALIISGCGGGGSGGSKPLAKADYVKQMQAIGHGLSDSLNSLSAAGGSAKAAATALAKVQEDLRKAADQLEKITPPDDVKTEQKQLADSVREFADELDPLIKKVRGGNVAVLGSLTSLKGVTDIQKASTEITKKGYKIGA